MNIRNLQLKDASLMLEWMHDKSMVEDLHEDFCNKTIDDCRKFIFDSWKDTENIHLAVVDDMDTYMGTVSLKHIDIYRKQAEFAIAIRSCATGRGISQYAMKEILRKGFKEMKLEKIYWCVSENNKRAIRFYEKNRYERINVNDISYIGGGTKNLNSSPIFGIRQKDKEKCRSKYIEYFSNNFWVGESFE